MSRSMELQFNLTSACNAQVLQMTVPADHKYELLEIEWFATNPGVNSATAYRRLPGPFDRLIEWQNPPAFARQGRMIWPGLVLYAGEGLVTNMTQINPATTYQLTIMYIDVDYTA